MNTTSNADAGKNLLWPGATPLLVRLYRFIRQPGYLAMSVSIPASAVAIGSWLALFPAAAFVTVIRHRAEIEDKFPRVNLPDYVEYAQRVRSGLLLGEERPTRQVENARSLP